ncbi:helix-turn-helix domain-containing protein [Myroides sp. DW712]|uniref:helix-turn-helix domain-containing protein n=1 Tax=Myroides sp. DW712 TaxID=3389800 RepID=UPI003977F6D0
MDKLDLLKRVGENIKYQRELKNLSQVELVGLMEGNIDTTNISRIESGRTNPTIFTLYRISKALNISVSKLLLVPEEI